jgi:restriction system protein
MVSVPPFDELMWSALKALQAMGGSGTNEEILNKVIELENIPPEVQSIQHTDHRQSRLNYNLAWAKTYLKKVGAIDNSSRGVWAITKEGEKLSKTDIALVPSQVRKQVLENRRARDSAAPEESSIAIGGVEEIDTGEAFWKDKLLEVLCGLRPDAFERLAQRVLREAGFIKVEVTGKSGDGGIDGIGVLRVNLLSFQVLFQCKRYQTTVGAAQFVIFAEQWSGVAIKGFSLRRGRSRRTQSERPREMALPR